MASSKYGQKSQDKVESAMRRRKKGTLKSGSGKKVTSRKQAVAIGLSEARREGGKVPPPPRKSSAKKSSAKKSSAKKSSARKSSSKQSTTKSSSRNASASRKSSAKKSSSRKSSSKKK